MVTSAACRNGSVSDFLMYVLRVVDVGNESSISAAKVYAAVEMTVTCKFTASYKAKEGQCKSGPEHDGIYR